MNATDCMSCRARGCGAGDVTERNTATGTVVECRTCGFTLNREERDAIASYYERATAAPAAEPARDADALQRAEAWLAAYEAETALVPIGACIVGGTLCGTSTYDLRQHAAYVARNALAAARKGGAK